MDYAEREADGGKISKGYPNSPNGDIDGRLYYIEVALIEHPKVVDSIAMYRNGDKMQNKRVALVVGVSNYTDSPLPNPIRDAQSLARTLNKRNFYVNLLTDPTTDSLGAALKEFEEDSSNAEISLLYFAGHGVEINGAGFILASDFPFPASPQRLIHYGISTSDIFSSLRHTKASKVVIIDACRVNLAVPGEIEVNKVIPELDHIRHAESTLSNLVISYSTSAGEKALDGRGENSLFCTFLCEMLERHGISIEDTFKEVGLSVMRASEGKQRPWYYSSLDREVRFSDIGAFQLIQAHQLPKSDDIGHLQSMAGTHGRADVTLTPGNSKLFLATISHSILSDASLKSPIQALSMSPNGDVVAVDEEGHLVFFKKDGAAHAIKPDFPSMPYGIRVSTGGEMVAILGNGFVVVYYVEGKKVKMIINYECRTWNAYAGLFVGSNELWVAGDNGCIVILDLTGNLPPYTINDENRNIIYAADLIEDGSSVALVGGRGRVTIYSAKDRTRTSEFNLPSASQVSKIRRESLINSVQAEMVTDFLYNPHWLSEEQLEHCNAHLPPNDLMFCTVSRIQPIIAVGSTEGLLYLVDHRDGQIIQTIDACAGRGNKIDGLQFIFGGVLAALTSDSYLLHYSNAAIPSSYEELSSIGLSDAHLQRIFKPSTDRVPPALNRRGE